MTSNLIARNTLMLYLRMLISMLVGLYTSRVVLQTLGVEDYGIYNLVGGIVSILSFLNASMTSATSRFITYDLGKGDLQQLRDTFNAAFQSHLIIALVVLIFAETAGLWIVTHHLVIPTERIPAALWVYQLSVLSTLISITQVPYSATIMAHEKMDVYAWMEILNVTLKLVIVWLIQVIDFDRMLSYGLLTLAVTLLMQGLYRLYCHRHYSESHLLFRWQPQSIRRMLSFSGWNLYADASVTLRQQGVNILINRFFGVILNASCAVASMIQGAVWTCGYYVLAAFHPQIVKQYAQGNYRGMQQMMSQSLRYTLLLFLLVTIPALLFMPLLMQFWLGEVPCYATLFCQLLLIDNLFGLINHTFTIGLYAKGEIRRFSLLNGTLKLLCLPLILVWLLITPHPAVPYLLNIGMLVLITGVNLWLLKAELPQLSLRALLLSTAQPLLLSTLSLVFVLPLYLILPSGLLQAITVTLLFALLLALSTYHFLLDPATRSTLKQRFIHLLHQGRQRQSIPH